MSSVQEILIIALLFVLVIFLPRRLGRRRSEKKSGKMIMKALSGKVRLGVLVSAVWLLSWTVYFRPWSGEFLSFTLVGLSPVILGWGVLWVVEGFKKGQDA